MMCQTKIKVLGSIVVIAGFFGGSAWADTTDLTCPSPKPPEQLAHNHVDKYYEVTGDKKKDAAAYAAALNAANAEAKRDGDAAIIKCDKSVTGFQCNVVNSSPMTILSAPQPQEDSEGHYVYVGWRRMGECVMPKEGKVGGGLIMNETNTGATKNPIEMKMPSENKQKPGSDRNPGTLVVPGTNTEAQ